MKRIQHDLAPRQRRLPILACSLALLSLWIAGCGATKDRFEAAPQRLRVGFIGTVAGSPQGPEGWAYDHGALLPALRSQGVKEVTFTVFPNGPDLNEAMAAGALDVGMLGDTPAIIGHAAGIPTHLVNQTAVGTNCWLVVRADGPKTVEDLKGKVVATQKGSYMARYLLGLLAQRGLSKDVKFVHLMNTDSEAALRRGDIAAYASPQGPVLIAHGFRAIDQAADHPDLQGSGVTVVTDTYLAAHPGFPAAWNAARAEGIREIGKHHDEYYAAQAARIRVPVAEYRSLYPTRTMLAQPLTPHGLALLEGTKKFLVDQHLAKSDFAISQWIAPQIANEAAATHVASAAGSSPQSHGNLQ